MKNKTYYTAAPIQTAIGWFLNSTTITLNSTTAYLNGYFTPVVVNQLNTKIPTTFTEL